MYGFPWTQNKIARSITHSHTPIAYQSHVLTCSQHNLSYTVVSTHEDNAYEKLNNVIHFQSAILYYPCSTNIPRKQLSNCTESVVTLTVSCSESCHQTVISCICHVTKCFAMHARYFSASHNIQLLLTLFTDSITYRIYSSSMFYQ